MYSSIQYSGDWLLVVLYYSFHIETEYLQYYSTVETDTRNLFYTAFDHHTSDSNNLASLQSAFCITLHSILCCFQCTR